MDDVKINDLTNADENDREIEITHENGKKLQGKILFTFEISGDDFVVYTVNDVPHAARVDENNKLIEIRDDEWGIVENIYEEFMKEHIDPDKEIH